MGRLVELATKGSALKIIIIIIIYIAYNGFFSYGGCYSSKLNVNIECHKMSVPMI